MAETAEGPRQSAVVDVSFGSSNMDDVEFRGSGIKRDRDFGASRRSTASTKSVVSLNPKNVTSPYTASNLFAYRSGAIDAAVAQCTKSVVKPELDGEVTGIWLLTEIDHWDMEKEKLVLLTTNSLLIIRYDFIRLVQTDFRRILLRTISRVQIGDLVYPAYSLMPSRQHGGARIHWGKEEASWAQRWNPFCNDIGYVTLSHHLLAYKADERETVTYDVADMIDSVIAATNSVRRREGGDGVTVSVENGMISIESYGSVMSLVFNQSHLGFNLARGGVSF